MKMYSAQENDGSLQFCHVAAILRVFCKVKVWFVKCNNQSQENLAKKVQNQVLLRLQHLNVCQTHNTSHKKNFYSYIAQKTLSRWLEVCSFQFMICAFYLWTNTAYSSNTIFLSIHCKIRILY